MVPHLLSPSARRRTKFTVASPRRYVSCRNTSIIIKKISCGPRRRLRWSNIDCNLLDRVQRKLHFADALQCRAVCSQWRSVAQSYISSSLNSPTPQLPSLLLWNGPIKFFDVSRPRKKLYHLNRKSKQLLLDHQLCWCVGFSHGWFLFVDSIKENYLYLFHPLLFSATAVRFPPIVTPEGFYPILWPLPQVDDCIKVVLWADPILSEGNYGIAVIHSDYKKILFAKSGATQFTDLEYQDIEQEIVGRMKDIICYQNLVYGVALTEDGQHHIEAWDCTGRYASPTKILDFQPTFSSGNVLSSASTIHLVESQGELLLVSIQRPGRGEILHMFHSITMSFPRLAVLTRSRHTVRVFKMDFQQRKWVQMDSLGDCALFIMEDRNLSVSTIEFPRLKRNTVYFKTHMFAAGLHARCISVYNVEDGSMKEIWPEMSHSVFHYRKRKGAAGGSSSSTSRRRRQENS